MDAEQDNIKLLGGVVLLTLLHAMTVTIATQGTTAMIFITNIHALKERTQAVVHLLAPTVSVVHFRRVLGRSSATVVPLALPLQREAHLVLDVSPERILSLHCLFPPPTRRHHRLACSFITSVGDIASGSVVFDATLQNGATVSNNQLMLSAAQSQYMSINSFTTGTAGLTFACWYKSDVGRPSSAFKTVFLHNKKRKPRSISALEKAG